MTTTTSRGGGGGEAAPNRGDDASKIKRNFLSRRKMSAPSPLDTSNFYIDLTTPTTALSDETAYLHTPTRCGDVNIDDGVFVRNDDDVIGRQSSNRRFPRTPDGSRLTSPSNSGSPVKLTSPFSPVTSARRNTTGAVQPLTAQARKGLLKKQKGIAETAKLWADRFEELLADQRGVEIFRLFLRSEYSEENMTFWIACEQLKRTRSFRVTPRAKRIFKQYIEVNAPHEVNLDYDTKQRLRDYMKQPHRTMFDEAQRKVREMLSADAYPRFIRSDAYRRIVES